MAIIIKCDPRNVGADDIFISDTVWIVDNCDLIPGDEAFVWWTAETAGNVGLAMHGNLVEIERDPTKRGWPGASLRVKIDAKSPGRKLTKKDLAKYAYDRTSTASETPGPLPKLWRKLLNNSWQKVASLDGDEAAYLRGYFGSAASGDAPFEIEKQNNLGGPVDRQLRNSTSGPIKDTVIAQHQTDHAWPAVAEDTAMLEGGPTDRRTQELIDHDLSASAIEGFPEDKIRNVRERVARLADVYIRYRIDRGLLTCEGRGFDPFKKVQGTAVKPRSLLDVHHKNPLDAGVRQTTLQDFCLLCPNCHRFEHAMMRSQNAS